MAFLIISDRISINPRARVKRLWLTLESPRRCQCTYRDRGAGVNPFSRYIKLSGLPPGAEARATRSNIDTYARLARARARARNPSRRRLAGGQKVRSKSQFAAADDIETRWMIVNESRLYVPAPLCTILMRHPPSRPPPAAGGGSVRFVS